MSRRRAREFALQALYEVDVSGSSAAPALRGLLAGVLEGDGVTTGRPADDDEQRFALRIVEGVCNHRDRIDALIESASTNWRLQRMPVVDRNILRLATFELAECGDVPANVSINEAIELAKKFGDKDSRAFVNGLLDRIAAETGRGGRHHRDG